MTNSDASASVQTHLHPDEKLLWAGTPAPPRKSIVHVLQRLFFAAVAGIAVSWLLEAESPLEPPLPLVLGAATFLFAFWQLGSGSRAAAGIHYAITDQRLLVAQGKRLRAFTPGQVSRLDVEPHSDGTFDLVWGEIPLDQRRTSRRNSNPSGLTFRFQDSRSYKLGFLGLASREPAESLVREWLRLHRERVAAAVPLEPASTSTAPITTASGSIPVPAPRTREGWKTVRERETGFALDLPSGWSFKVGRLKSHKFLGIRVDTPTRWFDGEAPGWNQLEADTGLENAPFQVNLNPLTMPESLEEVVNSTAVRLLNLKLIRSNADVQINGLTGFSAVHDMQNVGLNANLGPVKVGTGTMKVQVQQTQYWLRTNGQAVHVLFSCPTDAPALQEALERVVQSLRLERS